MRTLLVLLDKEFRQFFRNPFLPKMAVMFPLMVMLVIPWVTTQDVRHVGVAVVDHDRTAASRRILQKIGASDYYTLYDVADSYASALGALEEGGHRRDRRDSRRFRAFGRHGDAPEGQHLGQRRQRTQGEPRVAVYGADRDADPRRTACGERTGGRADRSRCRTATTPRSNTVST